MFIIIQLKWYIAKVSNDLELLENKVKHATAELSLGLNLAKP